MWSKRVVLPPPANSQGLGLSRRGEQLGVQELIPEPAIERLGKVDISRQSGRDVGCAGGSAGLVRLGNDPRALIAADEFRGRLRACQALLHRHQLLSRAAPAYPNCKPKTAVLDDHLHEHKSAVIGGGVELEIHGPNLVRVFGLVTPPTPSAGRARF
jgi:hypothetical protein